MKKVISLILCLCLSVSLICPAASAIDTSYFNSVDYLLKRGTAVSTILSTLVDNVILGFINKVIPNFSYVRDDEVPLNTENFYEGDKDFLPTDSLNTTWNVGYAQQSIIPDDFGKKLKYARGSYVPYTFASELYTDDDGKQEDLKVRTVVLDDNTGRGSVVFCSVDCIGISNNDVKQIRAALADFAKENHIKSLNISAIHSHMAIDSQGVWNNPISTIAQNILSYHFSVIPSRHGVNKDYMNNLIAQTKASVENAFADKKPGQLKYTDIALEGYMGARTVSKEVDSNMHKLSFIPADGSRETVIASFGAHPEVSSYGAEFEGKLSSDFVYYMEKLCNAAGKNFMFIQGNVGTNSCGTGNASDGLDLADNHEKAMRYGYEMAYICLGAEMNTDERIALNEQLGDKLGVGTYAQQENYTIWYEDLPTFAAQTVQAVCNVRHDLVKLEMDNNASRVLLKLGLASNDISYNSKENKYYTVTEIGYLQLGTALQIFLSPGELYSELYVGGYGLENSSIKSLRESYGENVILFDLMNDAAGYVCPDENYYVLDARYDPKSDSREMSIQTWLMVVSIGKHAASTLMNAYSDLVNSVKAK